MARTVEEIFARFADRWPEKGDRLVSPSRGLFLAEAADERNYRLLRGYKLAGDILVQSAYADRADRPNLIFPALFNYRHYIELALKSFIEEHGHLASVSLGTKSHKLLSLWSMFKLIIIQSSADPADPATLAVENCVREFDRLDTSSTTFRYATNLQGIAPSLPRDGLDLVGLHDVMNGIENYFESVDASLKHKAEIVAENHDPNDDWWP